MNNPKISDEELDQTLMANITSQWRKMARIVGTAMLQIDKHRRVGLIDLDFAKRVTVLVEKGLIEYQGNLHQMRKCEVRLLQKASHN